MSVMTAVELKSSIMSDLNTMGVELLEAVARYVHELSKPVSETPHSTTTRKIQISDRINKLRGRFSIPTNMDEKDLIANYLIEKHVG